MVSDQIFASFPADQANGRISWEKDVIRVMLLGDSYKPSKLHKRRSDLEPFEIIGDGYTKGGIVLNDRRLVTRDNVMYYQAADAFWPAPATLTARWAATYKSRGGAAEDDELICLSYLQNPKTGAMPMSLNGPFRVEWDPAGLMCVEMAVLEESVDTE